MNDTATGALRAEEARLRKPVRDTAREALAGGGVSEKEEITPCAPVGAGVLLQIASDEAQRIAGVAELADAYGSGPYGGNPMEVQVLSPAPLRIETRLRPGFLFL